MAVRSTQCQNRVVRSTQGGRGVSPSTTGNPFLVHKLKHLLCHPFEDKAINRDRFVRMCVRLCVRRSVAKTSHWLLFCRDAKFHR